MRWRIFGDERAEKKEKDNAEARRAQRFAENLVAIVGVASWFGE